MSASFYRRGIEENIWRPKILGVDFSERLARQLAKAAEQGIELWTAWAEIEPTPEHPGVVQQVTQETCHLVTSGLDDDADAVLLYDPRDTLWFRFNRLNHPDIFDWVAQTVAPWALRITGIVPLPQHYKPVLEQLTGEVNELTHRPDAEEMDRLVAEAVEELESGAPLDWFD